MTAKGIKGSFLDVRVVPGARQNKVSIQDDFVKVWVKARPKQGQANREVVSLFRRLDENARIARGHKSRRKRIHLPSIDPEAVYERLKRLTE